MARKAHDVQDAVTHWELNEAWYQAALNEKDPSVPHEVRTEGPGQPPGEGVYYASGGGGLFVAADPEDTPR